MSYASMWHKTNISQRMATYCIQKYVQQLKWRDYKEDILEVGCAEGSVTANILYPQIKNHVGKLLATDKLEGMIDSAKKENKIQEIDYQVLDVMDSQATEKYRNQFDHIFSLLVAHLIPDNRHFFTALRDMLKPNGQIYVTTLSDNFVMRSFRKLFGEAKWESYAPKKQIFAEYTDDPEKHLRELLNDVGFGIDVWQAEPGHFMTESFQDFIRAIVYLCAGLGIVSAEDQEDFVQEMIQNCAYECTYLGEPDKYEMPFQQFVFIATKID